MPEENNPVSQILNQNPASKEKAERFNVRMFLIGFLGLLGAIVLIAGGAGIYRVYAKTATDPFTLFVAKTLRLPALKVNSEQVLYTDYASDLEAIHKMKNYDLEQRNAGKEPSQTPGADLTEEQMTDQVLWRLLNTNLVDKSAKEYGVTAEESDMTDLRSQMLAQFLDTAAAEKELLSRYGWTMKEYENKVMRPFILQTKLADKIRGDEKAKEQVKKTAEQVLQEIKSGANFADMAKKYGSDSTAGNGGDLGWFGRGAMVPEFEDTVFSLKVGEVSPALVETVYGYHIVKLDDKKIEKTKDSKGKSVNAEQVKASHILFPFMDLNTYLEKKAKEAEKHLYLKIHNPFEQQTQA